jgi:hypothetical protein
VSDRSRAPCARRDGRFANARRRVASTIATTRSRDAAAIAPIDRSIETSVEPRCVVRGNASNLDAWYARV